MNILSVDGIVIWPNSNINPTNGSDIKCAFINSVPALAFQHCGAGRPVICKRSESLILIIAFWCTDYGTVFDCMELPNKNKIKKIKILIHALYRLQSKQCLTYFHIYMFIIFNY